MIKLTALLIITALALSACGGDSALPTTDDPAEVTLPMQVDGVHASVEVIINGKPARMLLDTGADQMALTPSAADRLGLSVKAMSTPGSGASGRYSAGVTTIPDIAVGGVHRENVTAYVVPLPAEFVYDGVLGTPFFASALTTLDYQQRTLTLRSNTSLDSAGLAAPIPIKLESGKWLVMATAAGVNGWFSIDTGAGNALTFFTPAVERYGLRDAFSPTVHTITGVSPGGYTRGTLVRVPEVTIGPFVFHQVMTELSEAEQGLFSTSSFSGNLGGELWRRFKVTFDYAHRQLSLTPNAAVDEPFVGPRSGLVPSWVDDTIQIIDVVAGSPADEAGLRAGQQIVAMNGVSIESKAEGAHVSLDDIIQALRAAPGTPVRLTVRNDSGMAQDAVLSLRDLL